MERIIFRLMDKRFGPCRALSPFTPVTREGANLLIFADFVNRYLHLN
jgi:hypothetical protein